MGSLILGKPTIKWTGRNCGGHVSAFLKAVYTGTSSEVKVGEEHSKPCTVPCDLRQGCIRSPLLFSLYINSLINKLKEADVGVMCRGQLISALLYADDAVIFAEELMRRGWTFWLNGVRSGW